MKKILSQKILLCSLLLSMLSGCATIGSSTRSTSTTEYIRDTKGQTIARIRDGSVYAPNGERTHRIDSQGNIYTTRSGNGRFAGERVGKIAK